MVWLVTQYAAQGNITHCFLTLARLESWGATCAMRAGVQTMQRDPTLTGGGRAAQQDMSINVACGLTPPISSSPVSLQIETF